MIMAASKNKSWNKVIIGLEKKEKIEWQSTLVVRDQTSLTLGIKRVWAELEQQPKLEPQNLDKPKV